MKKTLDSLVWIPKSLMSEQEQVMMMYNDLTIASENDYSSRQLSLFEEVEDHIGVPRYYFINKYGYDFDDKTIFPYINFPNFSGTLRDGQKVGTKAVLDRIATDCKYGGILQAKCGAGKTVSALYLASKLKSNTLVLVHKNDLLSQWAGACDIFLPKARVGKVQGSNRTFKNLPITIGTFQTVKSQWNSLNKQGFFNHFGTIIIDECHHVGAVTFTETLKLFSARIRLGLTATPRRRDGLEKAFEYSIGPILTVMEGETLTGEFKQTLYESNLNVNKYKMWGGKGNVSISKMITAICEDPYRNHFIFEVLKSGAEKGRKILVLSNRKAQLQHLHDEWKKNVGDSSGLYVGGMSKEQLDASTKKQMIFGTTNMFAEGTDIPALDTLCLISPMSDIEQMIGRIQRLYNGKKVPFVWDLVDNNKICLAMGKKRRKYLTDAGFTEQK